MFDIKKRLKFFMNKEITLSFFEFLTHNSYQPIQRISELVISVIFELRNNMDFKFNSEDGSLLPDSIILN